jgi:hypothetical protein
MIGTSTVSGPWWTHVAVGVGEAVNVGVMVAKRVGVTVARSASVGREARGVDVVVGVEVEVAKIPVPHPDNIIDNPMMKINIFFIVS